VSRAATSPTIAVGVRPLVRLTVAHARLVVQVTAKMSYRGRTVLIQKRRGTQWVTSSRLRLGSSGTAAVAAHGRIRVVVPAAPAICRPISSPLTVP